MTKQINVRVNDEAYAGIEARAAAVGLEVPEYVRLVVTDEANDVRHRFLAAGAHFADAWADEFAQQFGHPAQGSGGTHGAAA